MCPPAYDTVFSPLLRCPGWQGLSLGCQAFAFCDMASASSSALTANLLQCVFYNCDGSHPFHQKLSCDRLGTSLCMNPGFFWLSSCTHTGASAYAHYLLPHFSFQITVLYPSDLSGPQCSDPHQRSTYTFYRGGTFCKLSLLAWSQLHSPSCLHLSNYYLTATFSLYAFDVKLLCLNSWAAPFVWVLLKGALMYFLVSTSCLLCILGRHPHVYIRYSYALIYIILFLN